MICEILTACAAAKDNDGMFTINGAFTRLTIPHMPAQLQALVIAIRIRSTSDEDGQHTLRLFLSELDGKLLGPPAEAGFESKTLDGEEYTWAAAVIQIPNLRICESNDYLLSLQIDGQSIANTTLYILDGSKRKPK